MLGLLRVTRAFLPLLRAAPHAHIVNMGSIAGFEVYPGGVGYTASKHAVRAITDTLRLELNGEPIRITEVAPGRFFLRTNHLDRAGVTLDKRGRRGAAGARSSGGGGGGPAHHAARGG